MTSIAVKLVSSFLRKPKAQDQAFLASTWCRQMANANPDRARGLRFGDVGRDVDAVLDRGDTRALIRHSAGDPDSIVGWACYAEGPGVPVLHMVYVRKEHRGNGYGGELLAAIGIDRAASFVFTQRGPAKWMASAYPGGTYLALEDFLSP